MSAAEADGSAKSVEFVPPEIMMSGGQAGAQASLTDDEMTPKCGALITGELEGVVAVDDVIAAQGDEGIRVSAAAGGGPVFWDGIETAAVDAHSLVGGAWVAAPEFTVELNGPEQAGIFQHENLHHAGRPGLGARAELQVEASLRAVDTEAGIEARVAVFGAGLVPPESPEAALASRSQAAGRSGGAGEA
ncbi:MAG: hypothetical protein ACPL7M_11890 [Bryobacteraceae bacterium]